MGAVSDAVGAKPAKTGKSPGADKQGLVNRLAEMRDEISKHISTKEQDANTEGDAAHAENMRKVGVLRAVFSLVSVARQLLEGYDTPGS